MITEADDIVHAVGVVQDDDFVHAVVVHAVAVVQTEGIAHTYIVVHNNDIVIMTMLLFMQRALLTLIMLFMMALLMFTLRELFTRTVQNNSEEVATLWFRHTICLFSQLGHWISNQKVHRYSLFLPRDKLQWQLIDELFSC